LNPAPPPAWVGQVEELAGLRDLKYLMQLWARAITDAVSQVKAPPKLILPEYSLVIPGGDRDYFKSRHRRDFMIDYRGRLSNQGQALVGPW